MRFIGSGRIVALGTAVLLATGIGVAVAANTSPTAPSNAMSLGRGIDEFGMTRAFYRGHSVSFTYTKGFFCDRHVKSAASSNCEAGKKFRQAPKGGHDRLYITVPLGFGTKAMSMDCPNGLICVDHPGTIDLSRLEPVLKPLYPTLTDAQLTAALKNFATPGHNHFVATRAGGAPEWWSVRMVGVTHQALFRRINRHRSARYLLKQVRAGRTTGVIRTNLFLFFAVR
jgi:hypothetical protein